MLKDIISVTSLQKRSEIFVEDEINKTVRHFEICYLVGKKRRSVELAAWEKGSLLLNQIESAWTSLLIRLCTGVPIEVRLDPDGSESLMHDLYMDISADIMSRQTSNSEAVLQSINELADAALHDRELKRLFFTIPGLLQHLLNELQANRLPPRGRTSNLTQDADKNDAAFIANVGLVVGVPIACGKVSFQNRFQQLVYVCAILRLFHCMLFNSQTVVDRSNVLTPNPLTFVELLQTLSIQYDAQGVTRVLHHLQTARERAAAAPDSALEPPSERGRRRSSISSVASYASYSSYQQRYQQQQQQQSPPSHWDSDSESSSSDDESLPDEDTEETSYYKMTPSSMSSKEQQRNGMKRSNKEYHPPEVFDDNFPANDESASHSAGGKHVAGGGGDILRAISEYQVAVLLELDNVVTLAIWQGRSRAVVSETLATQLSKAGSEFTRHALIKVVRRFVELIESWQSLVLAYSPKKEKKQKRKDMTRKREKQNEGETHILKRSLGSFAVRIYQHARLLQVLVLGSYRVLDHILDNSEEELRYYLFKPDFYSSLGDVPMGAVQFKQIVVLNRISIGIIEELRCAIDSLEMRKERAIKEQSVLLI